MAEASRTAVPDEEVAEERQPVGAAREFSPASGEGEVTPAAQAHAVQGQAFGRCRKLAWHGDPGFPDASAQHSSGNQYRCSPTNFHDTSPWFWSRNEHPDTHGMFQRN
jgi:hypothetical protein